VANNYNHAGQQFDTTSGLYSLRARYYNPSEGRFLSRDTWQIDINNPIELNRYGYAQTNPINYTDPTGKVSFTGFAKALATVAVPAIPILTRLGIKIAAKLIRAAIRTCLRKEM
jgi:RHS repeat-associated protein